MSKREARLAEEQLAREAAQRIDESAAPPEQVEYVVEYDGELHDPEERHAT